jgi:hypothetical protein
MKIRCPWLVKSALLLGLGVQAPATAEAGNWFSNQYNGWCAHYRYNRDWPEQHLDHDRAAARAPFAMMVANGWRSQNTISNYHFDDYSGELNDTGKLKVRAILTQTPPQYRSLYVLRADSPELTDARVRAVQDHAQMLMRGEGAPPVLVSDKEPFGASGEYVNGVSTRALENAVPPVLPAVQRTTEN